MVLNNLGPIFNNNEFVLLLPASNQPGSQILLIAIVTALVWEGSKVLKIVNSFPSWIE